LPVLFLGNSDTRYALSKLHLQPSHDLAMNRVCTGTREKDQTHRERIRCT
jgi:hypothetical protein